MGLTMVELVIALALIGFVLLGITPLFIASVRFNSSGNEYTSIHVLARDRLEQLMNLPFTAAQLSPGNHCSDLATVLPDPKTGLPPTPGPRTVRNPFTLTYDVLQFQIPGACATCPPAVDEDQPFTPLEITVAQKVFQYKRIDVTVRSSTGGLGIGTRAARVSGIVSNPAPQTILSADKTTVDCR